MIMSKRILVLFFALSMTVFIQAQSYIVNKHIGTENGLSNNFIQDMVIDKRGFVWVATESGVNRVAGNTVNVYRYSDAGSSRGSIIGNEIRSIHYNEKNDKVIISTDKGLSIYDCEAATFYNINEKQGLTDLAINDIAEAGEDEVWLISAKGHITRMNCKTYDLTPLKIGITGLRAAMDDGNGHLYLGHQLRNGMSVVNLDDKTIRNYVNEPDDSQSIPGNNVRCIYQDHFKNIWVGTNMGLALFNPATGKFQKVTQKGRQSSENVFDIIEMPDNQLWVATDMGGIYVVSLNEVSAGKPVTYSEDVKVILTSINTRCIVRDKFGNIWVGNYSTGIDFIAAKKEDFHILANFDQQHQPKRTYGVTSDSKGNIWLGGENELQVCEAGGAIRSWDISKIMKRDNSFIMCVMADSHDNIWLGVEDDGIIKFNARTQQMERIDIGYPVADIRSFYEDGDGRIWIGSEFGIFVYDKGKVTKPQKENNVMGNAVVFSFAEIDSLMLMGTYAKGLYIFDRKTLRYDSVSVRQGLPSRNINHILLDRHKGLWIATPDGLCHIKDIHHPDRLDIYDERKGLADRHVRAVQEDRSGRIWVSTYSGISCLDRKKDVFYNYNHLNGLPPGSFIAGSATTLPDGTMYFGSPTGVCYFNPQLQNNDAKVSEAEIVFCEAYNPAGNDTEILNLMPDDDMQVHANYQQNTLRIAFTVKDYSQVGNVEYSYMMKGMNDKWYYIGNDHDVVFRGLRPGHYTFVLRAKLTGQDWESASATQFEIIIAPPFWRTWWAYLAYLLLAGVIVLYLLRNYKHKLKLENSLELERRENLQKQELNEERLRFFTNITHELRTPLTLILGPLEDLVGDKRMPETYRKKVELINKSAGRLRDLINEILEFRKTETQNRRLTVAKGDLGALVKEIGQNFKQMNRNPKVDIYVMVRPDIPPVYFDSEIITTILTNFMSNAVKYTPEGKISLVMLMENDCVKISVMDTGYGIDKASLPHIFDRYYQAEGKHLASGTGIGLALVKSLADLHEGQVSVESEPGKGSNFTFSLLVANTYPNALHKEDEESDKTDENTESTSAMEEPDEGRPLLLVVEDNDDIRQYIADSMGEDYRIIQAADGMEGSRLAMEQIPDIIVSDIMMPKMNGIEFTQRVKKDIRTSHIPIILLTAKDSLEDKEEGYDSGADSYLTKPFSARLLQSRINNLLSTRRKLAELIALRGAMAISQPTEPAEDVLLEDNEPRLSRLDQEFISKLNKVIEENITKEDLDMNFMTDKMAMSHSTFYRKVKALTGISAKEYIRRLRLQKSAQLLKSGNYTVTEAATLTGFNDMGHFREIFKKEFGVTPSDYTKKSLNI